MPIEIVILITLSCVCALGILWNLRQLAQIQQASAVQVVKTEQWQQQVQQPVQQILETLRLTENETKLQQAALQEAILKQVHDGQLKVMQMTQDQLLKGMSEIRQQITNTLQQNTQFIGQRVDKLTQQTDLRLKEINKQVEKRLTEGLEKTTATFTNIIKRLTIIDEAQKKITELSSNVVSLQAILDDKRSRGTFGEVQLNTLIRNMIPANHYAFQHTLSNNKRVDCILFLPDPSGNIPIDSKFPLESYRKIQDKSLGDSDHRTAEQTFRQDIRKHIHDISSKYILPGETADGAVMFIPAEAVFAEIHANFPELVDLAHRHKVWMVSPTTLMAVLTTARAVLKDEATREQVHVIQEHLHHLAKDFSRFEKRMDNLSKHINQASEDVSAVHTSAKKITSRFTKIEQVQLQTDDAPALAALTDDTVTT